MSVSRLRLAIFTFGGFAEVFYFLRLQFAHLARLHVEHKRTVADAADFLDVVADLFEHLAQFAIAAFDEDNFKPGVLRTVLTTRSRAAALAGVEAADLGWSGGHATRSGLSAIDTYAFAKTIEIVFGGLSTDLHEVSLLHSRRRACELVGQFAVVGDQQETFADVVKAAHRIEALAHLAEELHHGRAAFGIADGGEVALGLVKHEIAMALRALEEFAIDADVVAGGIGFRTQFCNDCAVHLNAALRDEFFRVAAAGDAGLRKNLLKALQFGGGLRFGLGLLGFVCLFDEWL